MKRSYIVGLVILIVAAVLALFWFQNGSDTSQEPDSEDLPEEDPMDIALDFYNLWLDAKNSTSTDPFAEGLASNAMLSSSVQEYITANRDAEIDPVLCQPITPPKVGARPLYREDRSAQVQVLARGLAETSPHNAVVTLNAVDGAWQISEISCQTGESGPKGEFDFEQEGQLLKDVPAPLNSDYWHLVFTQSDTPGHVVPLLFDENSMCIDEQGASTVCDESTFTQTVEVTVKGDMTESGVEVRELVF